MRGVTSVVLDRVFARCISTHTPHVRRDGMKLQAMMERQEFQLTRLMRGVTFPDVYLLLKLSITLDTLTARILKLSSDSQSGIEPTPFYSWWNPADCRADPAVAPVAHKISPDHRF